MKTSEREHTISEPLQVAVVLPFRRFPHTTLNMPRRPMGTRPIIVDTNKIPIASSQQLHIEMSVPTNKNTVEEGRNRWPSASQLQGRGLRLHADTVEDARYASLNFFIFYSLYRDETPSGYIFGCYFSRFIKTLGLFD